MIFGFVTRSAHQDRVPGSGVKRNKGRNTTVIQIRVRDEVAATVKGLAEKRGCTVSDIVRPLLLDYRYKLLA
jgi:hypothetical protein